MLATARKDYTTMHDSRQLGHHKLDLPMLATTMLLLLSQAVALITAFVVVSLCYHHVYILSPTVSLRTCKAIGHFLEGTLEAGSSVLASYCAGRCRILPAKTPVVASCRLLWVHIHLILQQGLCL